MQHVKLARDRRKRKSRIKAAIFFAALLLILTGIFLAFKDTADYDPSLQSNLEPEMVDNVQYQSLTPEKTESDKQQTQAGEHPETKQKYQVLLRVHMLSNMIFTIGMHKQNLS